MNYFLETYLFAMSVLVIAGKSSSESLELCFRFKSSERQILRKEQELLIIIINVPQW